MFQINHKLQHSQLLEIPKWNSTDHILKVHMLHYIYSLNTENISKIKILMHQSLVKYLHKVVEIKSRYCKILMKILFYVYRGFGPFVVAFINWLLLVDCGKCIWIMDDVNVLEFNEICCHL